MSVATPFLQIPESPTMAALHRLIMGDIHMESCFWHLPVLLLNPFACSFGRRGLLS